MKGDKLYDLLDLLDDDLVLESAEVRRNKWKERLMFPVIILIAIVLLCVVLTLNVNQASDRIGGEEGVLRDGVYYVYGGGGMPLPNETRVPQGIYAYVPGGEPELLVSVQDYSIDILFPAWDVNTHGLYFVDNRENALWRMDLETRELTCLYDLEEVPVPEEGGFWEQIEEAAGYNPYVFLNGLWEDRIALVCSDGAEYFDLVLDCRTGEVLSRTPDIPDRSWNLLVGDRVIETWQGEDAWDIDIREKGVSLLPEGMRADPVESREIGDAILVWCFPADHSGDGISFLLLADGSRIDLPEETEETWHRYLWVSGKWLFYTNNTRDPTPGMNRVFQELRVMDLETGETYLVSEEHHPYFALTDGTWFFTYGDYTVCYKLEYTPDGIPCGLTLVDTL